MLENVTLLSTRSSYSTTISSPLVLTSNSTKLQQVAGPT